jgi:putative tryptophan/tyrosine transport system substrate-binding protein
VNRREFIRVLGGAAAWPRVAHAQPIDRIRRIGALMGPAESDPEARAWLAAFEQGLAELGWSEHRNLRLDYRWAGGDLARIRGLAKDLVEQQPDLILASNSPGVAALMRETRTIPIVFASLSDPVDSGLISNLARPGANVTGFSAFEYSLAGKWLEVLKAIAPGISRVALVFNPETAPFAQNYISTLQAAGALLAVEPSAAPVHDAGEIERAIAAQAREPGGSILVMPTNFAMVNRAPIIALAARYRLPAIYPFRVMAIEGGLAFYGAGPPTLYRRAASYADRILRGANPGELPVQQPTKYELVINLKTAKALGLDVPTSVLALADEVIE